ncbi:MAG: DUF2283 domain-containing protein [Candidatus Saliniplasma sp.]
MKYEYDRETDILLIKLSEEEPDFGEQSGSIITHYSKDGKPIEIEILDASETTLSMIKPILASRKKVSA